MTSVFDSDPGRRFACQILEAAQHTDWSSEKKFQYVFDEAKKGFTDFSITLKDSELRAIIEFLVNSLKKNGAIA